MARDCPRTATAVLLLALLVSTPICYGGEQIRLLILGHIGHIHLLRRFLDNEPSVVYQAVPARDPGGGIDKARLEKMIRLYFPRTYDDLRDFDLIMLTSPEYYLFTPKQDQWMYDSIREGAGGLNDGSVFSIVAGIAESWSSSLTQQAFPNDAPAVTAKGAGESSSRFHNVVINRDHPEAILTSFVPFGVENIVGVSASRRVIHREGSRVIAWQLGNFIGEGLVDYLADWEYGEGRAITSGEFMAGGGHPGSWLAYPANPTMNQYSPDILMNMIFWLTKRKLIEDVVVFHRVKANFAEFRSRMAILVSLMDFIDRFGASTGKIQDQVRLLEDEYSEASGLYLDQEFIESERRIHDALQLFADAEEVARREKDAALMWVYVVEWLVASSTFFVSAFVLWTLMIRRRLYREVAATKLR